MHFSSGYANILKRCSAEHNIRVWRSLVSRLNGVQEASSSNLDTRTKKTERAFALPVFFFLILQMNLRPLVAHPERFSRSEERVGAFAVTVTSVAGVPRITDPSTPLRVAQDDAKYNTPLTFDRCNGIIGRTRRVVRAV